MRKGWAWDDACICLSFALVILHGPSWVNSFCRHASGGCNTCPDRCVPQTLVVYVRADPRQVRSAYSLLS